MRAEPCRLRLPSAIRAAPCRLRPLSRRRRAAGVVTSLAGAFLLLTVARDLGLYPDFTRPRDRGLPMSPWTWLAHTTAQLAGVRDDPLWALLAELAEEPDASPPGRAPALRTTTRRVARRLDAALGRRKSARHVIIAPRHGPCRAGARRRLYALDDLDVAHPPLRARLRPRLVARRRAGRPAALPMSIFETWQAGPAEHHRLCVYGALVALRGVLRPATDPGGYLSAYWDELDAVPEARDARRLARGHAALRGARGRPPAAGRAARAGRRRRRRPAVRRRPQRGGSALRRPVRRSPGGPGPAPADRRAAGGDDRRRAAARLVRRAARRRRARRGRPGAHPSPTARCGPRRASGRWRAATIRACSGGACASRSDPGGADRRPACSSSSSACRPRSPLRSPRRPTRAARPGRRESGHPRRPRSGDDGSPVVASRARAPARPARRRARPGRAGRRRAGAHVAALRRAVGRAARVRLRPAPRRDDRAARPRSLRRPARRRDARARRARRAARPWRHDGRDRAPGPRPARRALARRRLRRRDGVAARRRAADDRRPHPAHGRAGQVARRPRRRATSRAPRTSAPPPPGCTARCSRRSATPSSRPPASTP